MMSTWIVFFLAAAVMGGDGNGNKEKEFKALDQNRDNKLTLDELKKSLTQMFKSEDNNKNDEIDLDEFLQFQLKSESEKSQLEKNFAEYDLDGNKVITLSEMMDTVNRDFVQVDFNGDGNITFDEFKNV